MGIISFSAQGEQLTEFRDFLHQEHLRCRRQQIRGGIFYAQTKAYRWHRVVQAAKNYNITLIIEKHSGLLHRLKPYRKRLGLLAGIVFGAWICYHCTAFVRTIEIRGNTNVSQNEIFRILENIGIAYGTAFHDIDFTYVERQLCAQISDIRWAAIRHTGGRLIIDLREAAQPPEMQRDHIPCNYVSDVSAQILSINVLGGHAVVQTGDVVKAGDVLISGVEEDVNGVTKYYHATGEVTGIYEYPLELFQPFCEEITVHGDPATESFLLAFGRRIPISINFSPPDEPICYTEQVHPLMLFGHRTPFALIKGIHTPMTTTIAAYSPEEIDALLFEKMNRFEQNFHRSDTILKREIVRCETELGILLKINYIFEGVVGKESEIFVK